MAEVKPDIETFAKIKVIGVGGSGGNAVNRMIQAKIRGVEFVAVNTDVQALHHSSAPVKLHIGKTATRGLGAGMDPDQGRRAAEESSAELKEIVKGCDMVFITCGLGGGTGTGAAPAIAEMAKEAGALTVAVVTKPFAFEGAIRKNIAEAGHKELSDRVDTIITIPNDRVLQIIDKKTSLLEAFQIVDDVLRQGVQGISEMITAPGLINVDFADVRAIMANQGTALMGIGKGSGENRAVDAAKAAVASPLLEISIDGAHGILFIITGSADLGMFETSEVARVITGSAAPDAKVIFGAVLDESMKDDIRVTVIATGFDSEERDLATEALRSGIITPAALAQSLAPQKEHPAAFVRREPLREEPRVERFMERPVERVVQQPVSQERPIERMQDRYPERERPFQTKPVMPPEEVIAQPPQQVPQPIEIESPAAQKAATAPLPTKPMSEEEELEIPAFIRKKMM